jgi:hypothetical protein
VAEVLRPGNAGSNTAADHVIVLDAALAQLPTPLRTSDAHAAIPVLVRTDAAGTTHTFATHLTKRGAQFSLSANLGHLDIPTALRLLPPPPGPPPTGPAHPRPEKRAPRSNPATAPGSLSSPTWSTSQPGPREPG